METNTYDYLAFKLIIHPSVIEKFIVDNQIDVRAFMVYIKKLSNTEVEFVKNVIKDKVDIYYKEKLIYAFRKN